MLVNIIKTLLLLGFIILIGVSCKRVNPKCWGENKNKGIIESTLSIPCAKVSSSSDGYLITNDSAYQALLSGNAFDSTSCDAPNIDFDKYSLLGLYTSGQCNVKTERVVEEVKEKSKYHYQVKVKSCGSCKVAITSYNWVLVPKLPDNWTVTFDVINK